jgi:hypothetical protein
MLTVTFATIASTEVCSMILNTRCTIGGKLVARSTTAHTRDTGKGTGVVTAAIVNGTWIGGQARVTVYQQIVAWIARTSV